MSRLGVELRDLRFLMVVAETGSLSRAAARLGVAKSAVSRRVAALETELGVSLLDRSVSGVSLTQAGRDAYALASRTLADLDAFCETARANGIAQRGVLKLGTQAATLGPRLRKAIATWRIAHAQVDFRLCESGDREVVSALRERQISIGFLLAASLPPDLAAMPLWRERLIVAVPERDALAAFECLTWEQIRTQPLLVPAWPSSHAVRELQAGLLGSGVDFRPHYAGVVDLLNLVAIGEGIMVLSEPHREIAVAGVVFRHLAEANAYVGLSLAWSPGLEDPAAGSFVATVRDHLKSLSRLNES